MSRVAPRCVWGIVASAIVASITITATAEDMRPSGANGSLPIPSTASSEDSQPTGVQSPSVLVEWPQVAQDQSTPDAATEEECYSTACMLSYTKCTVTLPKECVDSSTQLCSCDFRRVLGACMCSDCHLPCG
jgi:hypothetical protein